MAFSSLRLHGIALAACFIFVMSIDSLVDRFQLGVAEPGQIVPNWSKNVPKSLALLGASLRSPQAITIFGSSELNPTKKAISTRFLLDHGMETFAFGHAFNQSMPILAELAASARDIKPWSKIVILISPGWFSTKGTTTQAFAEFVPPPILAKLMFDGEVDEAVRHHFAAYVSRNIAGFSKATPLMEFAAAYGARDGCDGIDRMLHCAMKGGRSLVDNYLRGQLAEYFARVNLVAKQFKGHYSPLNRENVKAIRNDEWASYLAAGISLEKSLQAKNSFSVNDHYYEQYAKDKLPIKIGAPLPGGGPEMEDFNQLVSFLQKKKARVLFVLQPYNAIALEQTSAYLPIRDSLAKTVENAGFAFLDLMDVRYQDGMLTDVMHLGEYGWQRINHAIWEVFAPEASRS